MNSASELDKLQEQVDRLERRLAETVSESQDFLYIVSHDFKGPLRAIMSSCMILAEDYSDSLDASAKAELKRQSDAARRMNKMLEELLKLSRLNRNEFRPVDLDLGEILIKVATRHGLEASQIDVTGRLSTVADPPLIEAFLNHLVENSVKFAKTDTPVHLTVARDGSEFAITDNGIGISPEHATRIFLPFEKLNGNDFPGEGMGLSAAKRIITRHQGSISAESCASGGLTVRFTLPTS
jgi:light-regulated signal transduction histidine kinase (bacteriophytochrome)